MNPQVSFVPNNLLKGRVVIASYNDHVRLLFSRASWLVQHHRVYPGLGSRHCHGINFGQA
jgi:hypothetical protein